MGINQSCYISSCVYSSFYSNYSFESNTKLLKAELFGVVSAGFGIWTKPSPAAKPQSVPNNVYPLRVVRVKDVNPQMAGRVVISGRAADVCVELNRLAA